MTHQLPNELKIQIIQHVDRKSLPAVLRVNSTFHDIGEPLLYHTIILKPFPSKSQLLGTATQCLNTVIRRPAVAAAVHSIGLNLFDWRPYVRHSESAFGAEEFFEAFRTALPKVLNLANLEISKWGNTAEDTIEQLPRGCRFPNLQHYYGPPEVLDDIQSIALKTLHIRSTGSSITPVTRAYSAAARLSGQTLRVLDVLLEGLDGHPDHGEWEGVIVEIPSLFPNLRRLSLELEPTISFVSVIYRGTTSHGISFSHWIRNSLRRRSWTSLFQTSRDCRICGYSESQVGRECQFRHKSSMSSTFTLVAPNFEPLF